MVNVSEKKQEETAAFFAKEFNFSFDSLHQLVDFFDDLREFSHHLSENHYYSEAINKKVIAINLDIHLLSLELPCLELIGCKFYNEAHKAILAEKKPEIDKSSFEAFYKQLNATEKKALETNQSLQKLVNEIKIEYGGKT